MRQALKISRDGVELIKSFEGLRHQASQLPDGRWTMGYGHTFSAREGAKVTPDDAESLLRFDLLPIMDAVNNAVTAPLSQNQFDAIVSFCFNIGVENFLSSAVLKRINDGHFEEAAVAMDSWRSAEYNGQTYVLAPLIKRRAAEKSLFLTPDEPGASPEWAHNLAPSRPVETEAFSLNPAPAPVFEPRDVYPVSEPSALTMVAPALAKDEFPASFHSQTASDQPKASLLPEHMKHLFELTEATRPAETQARLAPIPDILSTPPQPVYVAAPPLANLKPVQSSLDPYAGLSPSVANALRQADQVQYEPPFTPTPTMPMAHHAPQSMMSERERQLRAELEKLEAERLGHAPAINNFAPIEPDFHALEAARLEAQRQEFLRQEYLRQEAERQDAQRREAIRLEAQRLEFQRLDELRLEAARQDAIHQETLRQEVLRQETLRQEELQRARLEAIEAERVRAYQEQLRKEAEEREAQERARLEQEEKMRLQAQFDEAERVRRAQDEALRQQNELEAQRQAQLMRQDQQRQESMAANLVVPTPIGPAQSTPPVADNADGEAQRKADAAAALMRFYSPYAQSPLPKKIEEPPKPQAIEIVTPTLVTPSPLQSLEPKAEPVKPVDHGPYTNGVWVNNAFGGNKNTNPFEQGATSAPMPRTETAPLPDPVTLPLISEPIKEVEAPNHPSIEVRLINPYGGAPVIMGTDGELDFTQNFGSPSNLPPPVVTAVAPYRAPANVASEDPSSLSVPFDTKFNNSASLSVTTSEPEQPSLMLNRTQKPVSSAELNARISPEGVIMDDGSWWKNILDTLQWILLATIGVACVGGGVAAFLKSREAGANFGMQDLFVYIAQGMAVMGLLVIGLSIYFIIKRMNRLPRA